MGFKERRKRVEELCKKAILIEPGAGHLEEIADEFGKLIREISGNKGAAGLLPMNTLNSQCMGHRHRLCIFMTGNGHINAFDFIIAQVGMNKWKVAQVDPVQFTPKGFAELIFDEDLVTQTIETIHNSLDFVVYGALYGRRLAIA